MIKILPALQSLCVMFPNLDSVIVEQLSACMKEVILKTWQRLGSLVWREHNGSAAARWTNDEVQE